MKKLIAVMMVCSLALAVGVRAQDDNPNKKKKNGEEKGTATVAQPVPKPHGQHTGKGPEGANGPQMQHNDLKANQNVKLHGDPNAQNKVKMHTGANLEGDANAQTKTKLHTGAKVHGDVNAPTNTKVPTDTKVHGNAAVANDAKLKTPVNGDLKNQKGDFAKKGKHAKVDPTVVKASAQKFHAQHTDFKAQPNPQIKSVKFNKNFKIQNAQKWKGPKYVVFKNYHPQWHDQGWWHSHHDHIILVGGGWYFFNEGYWYPAWGYSNSEAYYPYDGPIYVGHNPEPPDHIIADVQATLQEQGFYTGEVDGLLGPLTRAALADYQQSAGLEPTAAMDEPTLESLGLS